MSCFPRHRGSEPQVLWVRKEQLQEDGTGTGLSDEQCYSSGANDASEIGVC